MDNFLADLYKEEMSKEAQDNIQAFTDSLSQNDLRDILGLEKVAASPDTIAEKRRKYALQRIARVQSTQQLRGLMDGVRSGTRQSVEHSKRIRRTAPSRYGKTLGGLAGAGAGLLYGRKKHTAAQVLYSALGAAAGTATGNLVGRGFEGKRKFVLR